MKTTLFNSLPLLAVTLLGILPRYASADNNILATSGFEDCLDNPTIKVQKFNVQFDRNTNMVDFDVAGNSQEIQNVTASMQITAYGKQIYENSFDPCGDKVHVPQLCPGK